MLTAPLPSQIDIRKLVTKGVEIKAEVPISSLPRIVDLLADDSGSLTVELEFYKDDQRLRRLDGKISGSVDMVCQRCLEPVAVEVGFEFKLAVVWSEENAQRLPASIEPLIVGEELYDLADVVSDELILNLPFVNYHEAADCKQQVGYVSSDPEVSERISEVAEKDNPFQVLENLKFDK
jgi:uncharacterized protein